MIEAQKTKFVAITPPGAIVDNAAFTTAAIDTKGFSYLTIVLSLGAMDIAMAALKVQESDASGSGYADITGTVGGTDFTLPSATDDNKIVVFHINLVGRKRYIDLVMTGGDGTTGTYASALALLSRGTDTPDSATEAGALVRVIV